MKLKDDKRRLITNNKRQGTVVFLLLVAAPGMINCLTARVKMDTLSEL